MEKVIPTILGGAIALKILDVIPDKGGGTMKRKRHRKRSRSYESTIARERASFAKAFHASEKELARKSHAGVKGIAREFHSGVRKSKTKLSRAL